jgi:rfaE bifunctional protein kinase chain/domain
MTTSHNIEISKLNSYLNSFVGKKIVVMGDLMLDSYLWGHVHRISPEAPVPVVDILSTEYRLGGAANVVNNIFSLHATPIIIGLVGDDTSGSELIRLFEEKGIMTDYIIRDKSRQTTVKSRIFAGGQQIIRYDIEKKHDVTAEIETLVLEHLEKILQDADALILEDYNKGFLTARIISSAIMMCNQKNIPITVDPKHKNFFEYIGCTVFKPNFAELQKNLGIEIINSADLHSAVKCLFSRVNPKYLILTMGENGLKIFDNDDNVIHIPTFAREVFDVSGAGDTVISVLTLCLTIGLDIQTSAIIANHAAGAVCGKKGIHPATIDDIILSAEYFAIFQKAKKNDSI